MQQQVIVNEGKWAQDILEECYKQLREMQVLNPELYKKIIAKQRDIEGDSC
ncbi:MAG TPA: hypothetical protein P5277_01275 [Candidatus Paceibacterota bacterium]|nr:hypothetical protein [Candidatus Paceibacterota bacterium]